MNEIKELFARLNGWKRCDTPKWFNEWKLRRRVGFPPSFFLKGKIFNYKAFKQQTEEQGNTLNNIYQFYRKKR